MSCSAKVQAAADMASYAVNCFGSARTSSAWGNNAPALGMQSASVLAPPPGYTGAPSMGQDMTFGFGPCSSMSSIADRDGINPQLCHGFYPSAAKAELFIMGKNPTVSVAYASPAPGRSYGTYSTNANASCV